MNERYDRECDGADMEILENLDPTRKEDIIKQATADGVCICPETFQPFIIIDRVRYNLTAGPEILIGDNDE